MILPPFFGLHSKYDEDSLKQSTISYITADIVTYKDPTPAINLSYNNLDILSYNIKNNIINLSYINTDILSFTQPIDKADISYLQCDILMYSLPPSVPDNILTVTARDKDSSAILSWQAPFDGKSSITRYDIQYKKTSDVDWIPFIFNSRNTFARVTGLLNNNEYHFRVAPVNTLGTGDYTLSNSTIPMPGNDNICDIVAYVSFDAANPVNMRSIACFSNKSILYTTEITSSGNSVTNSVNSYSIYIPGNPVSISFGGQNFISYHHAYIPESELYSWSLINDFTISFWFKPEDNPSSIRTIISATSDTAPKNSWKISYTNDSIIFSSGVVGDMKNIISAGNLNISLTEYSHIALCRSKGYISLFVNGFEKNEIFDNNNITINNANLFVGVYAANYNYNPLNGWGVVTESFKGFIDELFISRSCLYRKNFDTDLPNQIRTISEADCIDKDCGKLESPTNLQVFYIDT